MPFFRYCSATLAIWSLKITTLCHSVFSLRSPEVLSRQLSDVAMRMLTTGSPEFRRRISGSAPRLPTRMTLLTLPAITLLRAHPKQIPSLTPYRLRTIPACCGSLFPQGFCSLFVLCSSIPVVKECQQSTRPPHHFMWVRKDPLPNQ